MKLLSLEIGEQFRSLHPGFQVNFHQLTDKGVESMMAFQPFCFAGLNGSGKSNVLEALAAIFYHLEMCVAKFRPESFENHFKRNTCTPNVFSVKYLISSRGLESLLNNSKEIKLHTNIVTISKIKDEDPVMEVHPFDEPHNIRTFELIPFEDSKGKATSKAFLPDLVVGYSSGENEILSHPFIKSRLIHFDEYKESINKRPFTEPETSLIYIDEEMSQAVLLACLLFEDKETLQPLRDELGIVGIQSFRMNINLVNTGFTDKKDTSLIRMEPLLNHLNEQIEVLISCSSAHFYSNNGKKANKNDPSANRLVIDFFTKDDNNRNNSSKEQIRRSFKTAFDFFRFFQTLYELNNNLVSDDVKEEIYRSKGVYTEGKMPSPGPEDRAFHFLDFIILKEIKGLDKPKELLLREFSDGEHQFLHTMGICLMLKDRRTLLLLDEPETHFNPGWRAKFIKVLNDSLKAGGSNNFLKDVILTSHSPFVISDCLPNNVILFEKNENKRVTANRVSDLEKSFNTYGTSVELILDRLFNYRQSIGDLSNEELINIDFASISTEEEIELVKDRLQKLGDSIEKDMVLARLNRKLMKR